MRYIKIFWGLLLWIAAFGCTNSFHMKHLDTTEIDTLFENYYEGYIHFFPFVATMQGDNRFNDLLPNDISQKFKNDLISFCKHYLEIVDHVDTSNLPENYKINLEVLHEDLSLLIEEQQFHDEYTPVDQFNSLTISFPQMGSGFGIHPFKTVKDYFDFLKRVDGFVTWCDTAIANMQTGIKEGFTNPKVIMERTLPQLRSLITDDVAQNIFYKPVENFPKSFNTAERDSLKALYTNAIKDKIVPAYKKLYTFIEKEYIPACRKTSGIYGTPDWKKRYSVAIRYWTGTDISADSIYALGLNEVKRIKDEMETVRTKVKFKGSLDQFLTFTEEDKQFKPFRTADGILNYYKNVEERIKPELKVMFHLVPKAKFEIRQTEQFREASASAEYIVASADGSRPGVFYVPINNSTEYNYIDMEATFLHEAIPGHHYQLSIQQEMQNLPKFRKFGGSGAYIEGWALYCESLGKELGIYTDPYEYFGRLSNEMLRAVRLVVDVGMHTKGWTREQAIRYMKENTAISDAGAVAEIERYMIWPGQALAYKMGELKIKELRKKAEGALGAKFKISEFHDQILDQGALPPGILEKKIDRWLAGKTNN